MKKSIIRIAEAWDEELNGDSSKIETKDFVKIIENRISDPKNKELKKRLTSKIKNIKEKMIVYKINNDMATIVGRGFNGEVVEVEDVPLAMLAKTSGTPNQGTMPLPDDAEIERSQSSADFSGLSSGRQSELLKHILSKMQNQIELSTSDYKFLLQTIFDKQANQKNALAEIENYASKSPDKNAFIDNLIRVYDKNDFTIAEDKILVGAIITLKDSLKKNFTKTDIRNIFYMPTLNNNDKISHRIVSENLDDAKEVFQGFDDPAKIPNQVLRKAVEKEDQRRGPEQDDARILESQGIEDAEKVLRDPELALKFRDKIINIYKNVLEIDPQYKFSKQVIDLVKSKDTEAADESKLIESVSGIPGAQVSQYLYQDPNFLFKTKNASPADVQAFNEIKRKLFRAYNIISKDKKYKISDEFKAIYNKILNQHKEEAEQKQQQPDDQQAATSGDERQLVDLGVPENLITEIYKDPKGLVASLSASGKLEEAYTALTNGISKAIAKDPNYVSNTPKPIKDFLAAYNELNKKPGK